MSPTHARRRFFEEFQEQTRLKHAVLTAYIQEWAAKLLHWGGAGDTLWFVDAFAGAGRDQRGRPGSPLIALGVADDIRTGRMQRPEGRQVRMRILAIEESRARFRKLERAVEETFGAHPDIEVRHGTLTTILDRFLQYVGREPVLYFIDPWGLESVDASLLPSLLSAPHSEILALFSDVGALRLYALTQTDIPDFGQATSETLGIMSLFGDEDREEMVRAELERLGRSERGYANREAAEAILTRALGEEWRSDFAGQRLTDIPKRAVALYVRRLREAGAEFVTAVPICGRGRQHKYYLVHATKSQAGVEAFKTAVSRALAQSEEGEGFSFETDVSGAIGVIEQHFAGREVAWRDGGETVRRFALAHTSLFPNDLEGVKRTLAERGYRLPGRKIIYRFPTTPRQ